MIGGLGGGGFGGGGMGGGGFYQVAPEQPGREATPLVAGAFQFGGGLGGTVEQAAPSLRYSVDDLIQAIITIVEPASWQQNGGEAVITRLGGMLLINQTPSAHGKVATLLKAIGEQSANAQFLSVDAWWLELQRNELDQLLTAPANAADGAKSERRQSEVGLDAFTKIAQDAPAFRGRIACFSDQTVHLVSGNRRTAVISVIPTVGPAAAGYAPTVAVLNSGLLLQVRPTLGEGGDVVVDVQSSVTSWREQGAHQLHSSRPPVEVKHEASGITTKAGAEDFNATVDRVNIPAQELATTVRTSLGKVMLVGGLSLPSGKTDGVAPAGDDRQLYLFIQVNQAR
jgi:hypothetical protein